MSTAELEVKKARLARRILNEKDENIIIFMGENLRKIKRIAIDTPKREKLINEFMQFAEANSIDQRKLALERLLKIQETTPASHWTDEDIDNFKYEHLRAKYL